MSRRNSVARGIAVAPWPAVREKGDRVSDCDLKLPNCSNCECGHARCITYHSGKQAESTPIKSEVDTPHGSAFSPIRELSSTPTEAHARSDGNPSHLQNLVKSVRNVVVEPSKQPRFLGPSSGITLARMVMASIRTDHLPPSGIFAPQRSHEHAVTASSSALAKESPLPPCHVTDHLVEVYFQYRTPHLPIMERGVSRNMFTTYIVFAIALCNIPNPAGGTNRVLQSEGCFRSAIGWVEKVITYSKSDLETLRAGSLWHWTGIALRLGSDIGLHWGTEGLSLNTTPNELYERRRLWYSAYHLDRVLGITLDRPFGITDENTQAPLPNPWAVSRVSLGLEKDHFSIHHQRAHNHLFSIRNWPSTIAYHKPNFAPWLQDIQPRLQECVQHPSTDALYISLDTTYKLVASIKILQREGKLDVLWEASKEMRDRYPVSGVISTHQSFASTLSAMSETFHGAAGCRDVFDTLCSATIDLVINNDAEENRQSILTFERQVEDLLQQLYPSQEGVNEAGSMQMSDMLSADILVLARCLILLCSGQSSRLWTSFILDLIAG
ncbi:hypothetical protein BCR34DRAFT_677745 [Clohesyomyces aquaticus]|uniref:Xylanolytic transcriptional activator regulatory domain-containing protein n=1 Tax=Clohesyomyces aquaticus TaxID=1231657 RepID=A0A1Y1Y6Z5_9PLEO|nr:hypothetical protein BCR34DRAFT_677745 [Clohesyomyces aquaticus]